MAMLGKRRPARQRTGVSGLQRRGGDAPAAATAAAEATVVIERLAHDGRGVAHAASGKTLFVEGALPGERVEVAVHRTRKRYDEAHVRELLEPAAERAEPPCLHYGQCGGCDLQHLAVEAQREHKRTVLVELLQREGLELAEPPELLAGEALGYRRRARLGVKVDAQGRVHLGFRARHASRLIDIETCQVLQPDLSALLEPLRELLAGLEAPRLVGHLELVASATHRVVVVRQLRDNRADRHRWQAFGQAHGVVVARLLGREAPSLEWLGEAPALDYRLPGGDAELELGFAPGDFIQVNDQINRALVATARQWLAPVAGQRVLDLFAGIGNFGLPLALDGAVVTAAEGSPAMVARLQHNARRNGLDIEAQQLDLNDQVAVAQLLARLAPEAVVLDPPRDGADAVCRALIERPVARLVYIACDPATLARDAARLVHGGYRLTRVAVADMFVHTSHLESLLLLEYGATRPSSQGA
ncbi:TRAM domain-containing protein [Halomonas sp. MCCC 1A17488]|uniref:TRAM domain-containing protein n=1 Tax=unclassified Halomonas TaxID=2609666 RepID=UPI0018D21871|nr:TRAM domain-containing protein [Halomonas sp. SS10-MC5]MCE8015615.1 TRAM domain-containing protein [Halomonas sp. MCCC 1A17488]MCG3238948.1 TRAM domain-containing protein [Halomonas sp. MCCC 1A17488]QPP51099.1 TRAM domain-containing protein [Halomonas sp. SS10-MC5]